jgi:flavin-dependent dehydrogenase
VCELLYAQSEVPFETAKVEGRTGNVVHTDRGDLRAPLIVDALGWRRVLSNAEAIQPPEARLSRGLEVHPPAERDDLEIWIDPRYVPAGYGWSFPAGDEVRVGIGSFRPRDHVKAPTQRLAGDVGIFFCGDSAGHCLPTTAEGIRTAFYFGIACGREIRTVLDGRQSRGQALERYDAFCDDHLWKFRWMLRVQHLVGHVTGWPLLTNALRLMDRQRFVDWSFTHYRNIAPPEFAEPVEVAAPAAPLPEADPVSAIAV